MNHWKLVWAWQHIMKYLHTGRSKKRVRHANSLDGSNSEIHQDCITPVQLSETFAVQQNHENFLLHFVIRTKLGIMLLNKK
jgi:hypothetical protein